MANPTEDSLHAPNRNKNSYKGCFHYFVESLYVVSTRWLRRGYNDRQKEVYEIRNTRRRCNFTQQTYGFNDSNE